MNGSARWLGFVAASILLAQAGNAAGPYTSVATGFFDTPAVWGQIAGWVPDVNNYTVTTPYTVTVTNTYTTTGGIPGGSTNNLNSGTFAVGGNIPSTVVTGVFNLAGATIYLTNTTITTPQFHGVMNVNADTEVLVHKGSSGAANFFFGGGSLNHLRMTGAGNVTIRRFSTSSGNPPLFTVRLSSSSWSGEWKLMDDLTTTIVAYDNTSSGAGSPIDNNVTLYTNATFVFNNARSIGATFRGGGMVKWSNTAGGFVTNLSGAVIAPSNPNTGELVGSLNFALNAPGARPTFNFASGSFFDVDVTNATAGDSLNTYSNFPAGALGDRSMNFVIVSGAKLRPTLYTPAANTSIDITIMKVFLPATATITGTYGTPDIDLTNVPTGWSNLATDLRNGGTELHFTADYVKPLSTVTVTATDNTATEAGPTTGEFTITRTTPTNEALTVYYTVSGSAGSGGDFNNLASNVVFSIGQSNATVTVTPVDDVTPESDETVILTLATDPAYIVGVPSNATVTIASDDSSTAVTVTATDSTATEAGPTDGAFTVSRGTDTAGNLTVNYTVAGTATAGSDYTALAGSVVIPNGSSNAAVTVSPLDDSEIELSETVALTLASGVGYAIDTPSNATVNIVNDDLPTLTVTATDNTATEIGPTTGEFTVSRGTETNLSLTVFYTVAGSAAAGSDYTALAGSAVLAAGTSNVTISVAALDDPTIEIDETVVLTLATDVNYTVGTPSNATVTIQSEDLPTVTVAASDPTATENPATTGAFTVSRGTETNFNLTVNYTVDGSATAGSDYTALAGSVLIANGSSNATVTVTPLNDGDLEITETVVLSLAANVNYTIGAPSSNTVSITDDDYTPGGPYNDLQGGTFGNTNVWGTPSWWTPELATYTIDGFTVTVDETAANSVPGNSTIVLKSGGTLRWVTNAANTAQIILGTNILDGGAFTCPKLDVIYNLRGTVIVNSNTTFTLGSGASGKLLTFGGSPATRADVRGTGDMIFDGVGGADTPFVTCYLSTGSTWSGDLVIRKGTFQLNNVAASGVLSNDVAIYTNAVLTDSNIYAPFSGRVSGNGSYAFQSSVSAKTNSLLSGGVIAPAAPEVSGTIGRLIVGNSAGGSPVPGVFLLRSGSIYDLDVTNSNNDVLSGDGYVAASRWMMLTVESGAILRPNLYTPPASTNIDRTIMTASNGLAGAYTTFDLSGVPEGWSNLGTHLTNGNTELRFTADYVRTLATVTIAATSNTATEAGLTNGVITITRTTPTNASLTVYYTVSGTAQSGLDFTTLSSNVVIAAGASNATVTVAPVDDVTTETDETVILTLATNTEYDVGVPSNATVTIVSDDSGVAVTVTATDDTATEAGLTTGAFTVSRGVATAGNLTVNFTVGGTAGPGTDYSALSASVVIPNGSSNAAVTVTPIDDPDIELPETVILTLASGAGYAVDIPSNATVTIQSDDLPTVSVTANDPTATETGPTTGSFTVSRGAESNFNLTVYYTVGGSAASGPDFNNLASNVTILAGSSSQTVTVTPVDDAAPESDETVVLFLAANAGYIIGSPSSNTVTIADNDSGASYNDVQNGTFGDPIVWAQPGSWTPVFGTYFIDSHTVEINELATNTLPANALLHVNAGGTLKISATVAGEQVTLNGTTTLGGGTVNPANTFAKPTFKGVLQVDADTTFNTAYFPAGGEGSTHRLYFGTAPTAGNTVEIQGSGDLILTGGKGCSVYEKSTSAWSGDWVVSNGNVTVYQYRSAAVSNAVVLHTNGVFGFNTAAPMVGGRVSGNGVLQWNAGASAFCTNNAAAVVAPSAPDTAGSLGTFTFGNSAAASPAFTVVFAPGSTYELDVTASTNDLVSGNYTATANRHAKLQITAGAILKPTLYPQVYSIAIDRVIMIADQGITGTYATSDISLANVQAGWTNLATHLANGNTELHLTANYIKPPVTVLMFK